MPNKDIEKKNKTNREYYQRNKERLSAEQRVRSAIFNKEFPGVAKARQDKWRDNNPERMILARAKARCKTRGLEFNITLEDIKIPEFCPILGIKLERGVGEIKDSSPSLDRIDNSRGYVKGNVQIISMKANRIKTDATLEELEKVASYLKNLQQINDIKAILQ